MSRFDTDIPVIPDGWYFSVTFDRLSDEEGSLLSFDNNVVLCVLTI